MWQLLLKTIGLVSTAWVCWIYRKQGFTEVVMHQLLQNKKNNKLENAPLQSSMLGLDIYKKIGFEEIFKMGNYKI